MTRYLALVAVLLSLTAASCAETGNLQDEGPSRAPATPLPAATSLAAPAPSPSAAATPLQPIKRVTLPPLEAPAATQPPALPTVAIGYDGGVHHGRQGSYCWPVTANNTVCVDKIGWEDFDSAPAVSVKRGGELSVVVTTDESNPGEMQVQVYAVEETEPFLAPGDEVYSSPAGETTTLDLEPGVYFLSAFYKSGLGDVSYGFKLEMVD